MAFGDLGFICGRVSVPLCSLVLSKHGNATVQDMLNTGILPKCYPRSIDLANTIILSIGNDFIHIGALVVLGLILFNVKSKITAVGRQGMLHFFTMYGVLTAISLVVDSGVTPPGSASFPYFVSVQNGLTSATLACLALNSFWGYDFFADDSRTTIFVIRVICVVAFALTFVISLLTVQSWGGSSLAPDNAVGLFVVLYIFGIISLVIYVSFQLFLSIVLLQDWWATGAILLGCFFLIAGQVIMYGFSSNICVSVKHYIDGVFFATCANLFAVMMIYKYWDMITSEDLEFSVSNASSNWDVKELLADEPYDDGYSQYAGSTFAFNSNNQHTE